MIGVGEIRSNGRCRAWVIVIENRGQFRHSGPVFIAFAQAVEVRDPALHVHMGGRNEQGDLDAPGLGVLDDRLERGEVVLAVGEIAPIVAPAFFNALLPFRIMGFGLRRGRRRWSAA